RDDDKSFRHTTQSGHRQNKDDLEHIKWYRCEKCSYCSDAPFCKTFPHCSKCKPCNRYPDCYLGEMLRKDTTRTEKTATLQSTDKGPTGLPEADLKGLKGPTGPTGAPGPTGARGPTGPRCDLPHVGLSSLDALGMM